MLWTRAVTGPGITLGYAGSLRLLQVIGVVGGLTLFGVLLRRFAGMGDGAARRLNDTAIRFTLPVGIFVAMHDAALDASALGAPAIGWLVTLLLLALGWVIARALGMNRRVSATFVLAATFGNTGFIGYPAVVALFGEEWLPQAVLIDQIGPGALAVTFGAFLAASASTRTDEPFRWQVELARVIRFPPLIALVAGVLWRALNLPAFPSSVSDPLLAFGALTVPLVMVAFGLLIRAGELRRALPSASGVVVLRLVVSPLATLLLGMALGLPPGPMAVATVQLAMPTMMLTLMLAVRYDLEPKLAAAYILATFVVSAFTLPLWVLFLGGM